MGAGGFGEQSFTCWLFRHANAATARKAPSRSQSCATAVKDCRRPATNGRCVVPFTDSIFNNLFDPSSDHASFLTCRSIDIQHCSFALPRLSRRILLRICWDHPAQRSRGNFHFKRLIWRAGVVPPGRSLYLLLSYSLLGVLKCSKVSNYAMLCMASSGLHLISLYMHHVKISTDDKRVQDPLMSCHYGRVHRCSGGTCQPLRWQRGCSGTCVSPEARHTVTMISLLHRVSLRPTGAVAVATVTVSALPRHPEDACASAEVTQVLTGCKFSGASSDCCQRLDAVFYDTSSLAAG